MDHAYTSIYEGLTMGEMILVKGEITRSPELDSEDLINVYVRDTERVIGYLGIDSIELVDSSNPECRKYHPAFLRLCNQGLWKSRLFELCDGVNRN